MMEVFERLWKAGMLSGSPSSFNSGATAKEAAEFNWRAALEWAKTEACYGRVELDVIERELEGE